MDRRRFTEIYDAYAKRLFNYVLWMTRNRQAGEDIIQAVFIKVLNQLSIPGPEREIEAWLFTIARNQCLDYFRKRARWSRFRIHYSRESSLNSNNQIESRFAWEILGCCNAEERSLLYLHLRAGYSYKEIAGMFSSTENAVRVKSFRALAKLRKRYIKESP